MQQVLAACIASGLVCSSIYQSSSRVDPAFDKSKGEWRQLIAEGRGIDRVRHDGNKILDHLERFVMISVGQHCAVQSEVI